MVDMDPDLAELAATAEIMGVTLSRPALEMMCEDLSGYSLDKLKAACKRLRQESGKFSVHEIVNRMPGMWPTESIAWATAPRDEHNTFVTTREALTAWDVASQQTEFSGRMAFTESYRQAVSLAKSRGQSPEWVVSLGHDVALRDQAVLDAVKDGLLPPASAVKHLPHIPAGELEQLAGGRVTTHALLEHHKPVQGSLVQQLAEREAPVLDAARGRERVQELFSAISNIPVSQAPFEDAFEEHKRLVALEMESLKRLHKR